MKLQVDWETPVRMRLDPRHSPLYKVALDHLPVRPGVYVLGRQWGDNFEALYVGKARNIRQRMKTQLNNLRLMQHVREAKAGNRVVVAGVLVTHQGQQVDRCLPILERTLIRHFLSDGHDLVNIQGTRLRQHEVVSTRRPNRFVPKVMFTDRSRT